MTGYWGINNTKTRYSDSFIYPRYFNVFISYRLGLEKVEASLRSFKKDHSWLLLRFNV